MKDLIERLEKAAEGGEDLDREIVFALFPEAVVQPYYVGGPPLVFHAGPLLPDKRELPPFTTSLDAALTLVPEGWSYVVNTFPVQMKPAPAWVSRAHINPNDGSGRSGELGGAPTAPLALCIAALKARSEA